MTRVKVCGITRDADLDLAVDAGADAIGLIADVPVDTPREISPDDARRLAARVPPFVASVLVTMPTDPERAIDIARDVAPDVLQLHADLSPGDVADIAAATDASILQTVDAANLDAAHRYDDVADALLVDSTDEAGGGGTGRTHDWAATRELRDVVESPVVLAGGLTPDNVQDAIEAVDPYAVDVASGVEAAGGEKDPAAVRAFVRNATRASRRVRP
jgi:phosphoribosylanthranilate isomerase